MRDIRCRAKLKSDDPAIARRCAMGYYCKVEGRHYIILEDAQIAPIDPDKGGWEDGIYGFVEVEPETVGEVKNA